MKFTGRALTLLFITSLIFASCKKHPFDYRNKYLGDFKFDVTESGKFKEGDSTYATSYVWHGTVNYGDGDNKVIITFGRDLSIQPSIAKDGTLNQLPRLSGSFRDRKSVHFEIHIDDIKGEHFYDVSGSKE